MQLQEMFHSIVDQVGAKTVYGEPISAAGRTIVPVAKVRYGFGGGSGRKAADNQEGFGGGGGFVGKPVCVIEITEGATRFIPISSTLPVALAIGLGVCLGLLSSYWANGGNHRR
jgi:uncharacterized spore protein YtfJ